MMMSRRIAVLVTAASRRSQLRYQKFQHRRELHYATSLSSLSLSQSLSSSCSENKRLMSSSSSSSSSSTTTSSSTVSSITGWFKDVIRTKSLQPINPIIESLPSHENVLKSLDINNSSISNFNNTDLLNLLPDFSYMEPHHINDKIIGSIRRQYNVDLASLEVKLAASFTTRSATAVSNYQSDEDTNGAIDTNNASSSSISSSSTLLLELDRLQAPVMQLEDISELFTSLASPPDQIEDWYNVSDTVYEQTGKLREKMYQSRIIYRALVEIEQQQQQNQSSSASASTSSSFLVPFLKRGCHIEIEDSNNDNSNNSQNSQYIEIQNELLILNQRLLSIINYEKSSKAMRLQCMSDMYNCIGLTRLQSQTLLDNVNNNENGNDTSNDNNSSVWNLAKLQHNHMIQNPQTELLDTIYPEITKFLLPYLPKQTKLNLDGVGAFLDSKNQDGSLHSNNKYTMSSMMTEIQRKELLKSKYDFKQRIRLHGAIAGIIDFCDTILGIHVVQEQEQDDSKATSNKGWNKNVRLLHLYKKQNEESDGDDNSIYLGTIYLDLFADSYWRTDEAKELVTSKLFNSSLITSQTIGPIVVMSLKIYPIWDNTPVPITFSDLSQLLYQFGKSIQLLLQQSNIKNNYYLPSNKNNSEGMRLPEPSPIDASEVMAHFMEMWILNDGFLNRLAQLSSSSTKDNDDNANANANNDADDEQQQQQQDEVMLFDDDTLQILRNDYKKEKALQITNTMFLSALQFEVFTIFNPRGDETLVGLQERIANLYLPKSCQPDTSDLSPLLAVFQQSNDSQYMSMHATLYSNIISANLYEKFQFLLYEVRQQEDACKLGIGIRNLFISSDNNSNSLRQDIEELLLIGDNNNNNNNRSSTTTLKEEKAGGEDEEDNNNNSSSSSIIDDNDTMTANIISCAPLKRVYQFDKI